jgi:hypothetical protein
MTSDLIGILIAFGVVGLLVLCLSDWPRRK